MVKKITGNPPPRNTGAAGGIKGTGGVQKSQSVQGPDAVQSKTPIQTTGVNSVGGVGGAVKSDRSARIRQGTRGLTPAEKEYLLSLVSEEAEKMFGGGKITPRKRQIIEASVRMSLAAGMEEDDE